MRRTTLPTVAFAIAALALAGTLQAETTAYTWTGKGGFGPKSGGSKCYNYRMTVDVVVEGDKVKGDFQQEMREQRHFEATLAPDGTFKTTAIVGNGDRMDVTGVIRDGESRVVLDGYCKFDAKLTRK
jgi:hypothetical protein